MGRRKERRRAAISAAGRRVKLDLSAEPTGEMDSTSVQDKAGVDPDMEKQAGVPTSPSSSGSCFLLGQKPDALLLLGQYSDEEAPDSDSKRAELSGSASPVDPTDKVSEADDLYVDNISNDVKNEAGDGSLEVDKLECNDNQDATKLERNANNFDTVLCSVTEPTILPVPDACGTQPIGDLTDGWKMVLHEESSRYYYWNTQTGETSWDVPEALSNQMVAAESVAVADENILSTTYATHNNPGSVDIASEYANANPEISKGPVSGERTIKPGFSIPHSASYSEQLSTLQGAILDDHSQSLTEPCEMVHSQTTLLLERCEVLLQRLKRLERSSELHEWSLKIIWEIEIRLSDCKALAPYGSSLLPFWSYTEQRLNDIESSMGQDFSEVKTQHIESEGYGDVSVRADGTDGHRVSENGVLSGMDNSSLSDIETPAIDISGENTENDENAVIESQNIQPGSSVLISEDRQIDMPLKEVTESAISSQPISKEELHAAEDVDMDVEMEVDDEIPTNHNACSDLHAECHISTELPSFQPETSLPSEQIVIPLPPSDDWIPPPPAEPFPPPPPETEPVTPPPPEEAPIPPPYIDTIQSYPYSDQYGMDYSAHYQYYTSEAHGTSYYSHAELNHVSDPQPHQYYDALAQQSYSGPVSIGPVEPVVYYNAHGVVVPVSTVSSGFSSMVPYGEPISTAITGSVASDYNGSVTFSTKDDVVELPSQQFGTDNNLLSHEGDRDSIQMTTVSAASQPNISINQTENCAQAVSTNISKNLAKVSRMKKRAVAVATSLRSNKKVSSLVDKWKAAKEELHGNEDDEPEDAYEILEKKRKKEIENWHARQLASGEAQDNANFLPLGGDWRERVKRKRAESAEPVQTPSEDDKKERKQPDLVELSRGLPTGWQAYWDESSKEVYYGNLQTSETTWTRPCK